MENKIIQLLELDIVTNDNKVVFTKEAVELIHEIAKECRETKFYKYAADGGQEYSEEKTAEQIYIDMLYKIAHAPTTLHMKATTRLLIPLIDDKLKNLIIT